MKGNDRILVLIQGQRHHLEPVEALLDAPFIFEERWTPDIVEAVNPILLIVMGDDHYQIYQCVKVAQERGIPTLSVMDGIIEWRTVWERPRYGAGGNSLAKQLIVTDKIACLGYASARLLASWGAVNQCEIVGAPRLDPLFTSPYEKRRREEGRPLRLLVVTAKTPAFTPEHHRDVYQGLSDLRDVLAADPRWQVVWRLTGGLDYELGLDTQVSDLTGKEMRVVLSEVDAIISTPSTTLLEGMALNLPTALLDYGNRPMFNPAAWCITSRDHIKSVLDSMYQPDPRYMVWQEHLLRDQLAAHGYATERFAELIRAMSEIGRRRQSGETVPIPERILSTPAENDLAPCDRFVLSDLYPEHPVFGRKSLAGIQRELQALYDENKQLRRQIEANSISKFIMRNIRKISGAFKRKLG